MRRFRGQYLKMRKGQLSHFKSSKVYNSLLINQRITKREHITKKIKELRKVKKAIWPFLCCKDIL
jgi:hypothetical protein